MIIYHAYQQEHIKVFKQARTKHKSQRGGNSQISKEAHNNAVTCVSLRARV